MEKTSAILHIGTAGFGTPDPPHTNSIIRLRMSLEDGKLSRLGDPIQTAESPGWMTRHHNGKVYVAMEDTPGTLQAFHVSDAGMLTPCGAAVSSVGRCPCHAALDVSGRWLFAANYVEGSVCVCPVLPDGSLGRATDSKKMQGGDLIPAVLHDRQEGAHCHFIVSHPSNKWVVTCDLGLSTVFVFAFDAAKGSLHGAHDDPRHLRMSPGAGCRHCCWGGGGTLLFVNNELDCTVTVARFDVTMGALTAVQTVNTLPADVTGLRTHHRGGSDIMLHPNGRMLFVAARSSDPGIIAIFQVDGGALSLVGHESVSHPRAHTVFPDSPYTHTHTHTHTFAPANGICC